MEKPIEVGEVIAVLILWKTNCDVALSQVEQKNKYQAKLTVYFSQGQ